MTAIHWDIQPGIIVGLIPQGNSIVNGKVYCSLLVCLFACDSLLHAKSGKGTITDHRQQNAHSTICFFAP